MNFFHSKSIVSSLLLEITWAPTMFEHSPKVKTFLTNGLDSPCLVTKFAIWITGSWEASGKTPFLPAHSISNSILIIIQRIPHNIPKLRTRKGALLLHSPSGACAVKSSGLMSTSIWQFEAGLALNLNFPGRIEIQEQPTILWSIMKRNANWICTRSHRVMRNNGILGY